MIVPCSAEAAGENNGRGVKAIGMANTYVAVADDPWAIQYNPAGLSRISCCQLSGFIVPQQFDLPELRTTALAMALPLNHISLGAAVDRFGFDLYNETTVSVGAGKAISKNMFGGMSLNYHSLAIARYGNTSVVSVDAGVLAEIVPSVMIGGCFKNITNASYVQGDDDLPQCFAVGVGWKAVNDLLVTTELEKDIRYDASLKAGIEKTFLNILALRFGMANNPDKYSAGFSVRYAGIEFGYAGYSHAELGWTHQIEIAIQWGKRDEENR